MKCDGIPIASPGAQDSLFQCPASVRAVCRGKCDYGRWNRRRDELARLQDAYTGGPWHPVGGYPPAIPLVTARLPSSAGQLLSLALDQSPF